MKEYFKGKLQNSSKLLSAKTNNNDTVAVNYECAVFCRVEENLHSYILVDGVKYQANIAVNQYQAMIKALQNTIYCNYTTYLGIIKDMRFAKTVAREVRKKGYLLHSIVDIYVYGIEQIEQDSDVTHKNTSDK